MVVSHGSDDEVDITAMSLGAAARDELRRELLAVYREAFFGPPWNETEEHVAAYVARLDVDAERQGAALAVARGVVRRVRDRVGDPPQAAHDRERRLRGRSLETCRVVVGDGAVVVAPTEAEALRVKAFLVMQRNVVRDYLDVVALSDHLGPDAAVEILSGIDRYYTDRSGDHGSVLTSLVVALAAPNPRDTDVIDELPRYKGLDARYHDWKDVVSVCQRLALRLGGAT